MKDGPNLSQVAALIGDPARANMLSLLMDGRARTASELATEAGITKQTASAHLKKLIEGELLDRAVQGRHHYFRIHREDVASTLEMLMGLAEATSGKRSRFGPKDPALRHARRCYDHLAGDLGVFMFERMQAKGWIELGTPPETSLTAKGQEELHGFGLSIPVKQKRDTCRACLDWSERRYHLAGSVGAALLAHFIELKWTKASATSRALTFTPKGEATFKEWLAN